MLKKKRSFENIETPFSLFFSIFSYVWSVGQLNFPQPGLVSQARALLRGEDIAKPG